MKELVLDLAKYDEGIDLAAWKRQRGLWGVVLKVGGNEGSRIKTVYSRRIMLTQRLLVFILVSIITRLLLILSMLLQMLVI